MSSIRPCRDDERGTILAIVNAAAEAYRGKIPEDCWHEPYMPLAELESEIAAGVKFWGYEVDGALTGVMGIQPVRDVDLIRHAYVLPSSQRQGVGGALLEPLQRLSGRRMLVGTWAAADWAISLSPSWLRAGCTRAQNCAAQGLLDRPRSPNRDLGRARQSVARPGVRTCLTRQAAGRRLPNPRGSVAACPRSG